MAWIVVGSSARKLYDSSITTNESSGYANIWQTMYTTNGFATDTRFLRADTVGCHWAVSQAQFTTGQKDLDNDRIICVTKGRFSPWRKDFRLSISDDFFTSNGNDVQEFEPELEPGRTVQGIVNMVGVTRYLIVAATAEGTDEMALYISDDTIKWHRAMFPHDHKITENAHAYTILESTNYSLRIDVLNTRLSNPVGVLLSSNSNGTYFTRNADHTNRHVTGYVDFEQVTGIQGIVLINIVDNWDDVEKDSGAKKNVKSQISFNDGRTWNSLKMQVDNKDLHLHSVTDLDNTGRVFSSPAPGIAMGIGNTGDFLGDFQEGNLYVSDNAGVTWHKALDGPHKYEFGDQGSILVAIRDEVTDEVSYSLNHGKDWDIVKLEKKVKPIELTTTADSTSLKFLLEAVEDKQDNGEGYIIVLDFNDMHEDKCKPDDMEEWYARSRDDNPTCLMGHEQSFIRRKADAKCFIMKEFVDPEPKLTRCSCTDADYECDYNFVRSADGKECVRDGDPILPDGACKAFGPDDTFKASSGWRLIPGNDCKPEGKQKDELVDMKCVDAVGDPLSGEISHTLKIFDNADSFMNKVYLERTSSSSGDDETVLMRTENGVFLSHDHGKNWVQILEDVEVDAIYPHPHFNDMVFFITPTQRVFYSTDRGGNIREFRARLPPNKEGLPVLSLHPKYKDWFIWTGAKDCDSRSTCHSVAYYTQDRGDTWKILQRYVGKCEFINDFERKDRDEKLIYCKVHEHENNDPDNTMKLVSSDDFFSASPKVHFQNVVDFATMSEFIVVATRDEAHSTLKVDASVDGTTFADAEFPYGFKVDHQQGYTVLDSSTHSVFLHVTVNAENGLEYGTIIKSNSNGTSYVLALDAVDRDSAGNVDFEKMAGIEGVAIVNVVANYNSKNYAKDGKKLKTMITHNDGGEWDYIQPPASDADGKPFGCKGSPNKCSLHLHGYSERSDKSHVFYSQSAIGLMLGTGNVGEYLDPNEIDTFVTSDAGVTWKSSKKGKYMWEFGDQGSIVVIVKEREKTNIIHYSLDEGDSWKDYRFSDKEVEIDDITTVPSDNARNFLLWGSDGSKILTVNLDFTGLTDVQCKLDENDVEGGDYTLWTPKHPKQEDDCLFGHVSQYHRKRTDHMCYNGRMIPRLHDIAKNCTCSRRDFEWLVTAS